MLEIIKEMIEYYCWDGYPIWKFLIVIVLEILAISWIVTKMMEIVLVFKNDEFDEYEESESKSKNDEFIFDISIYDDFNIFTPLSQQEKP